jgi:hypothetical protein
MKKRFPLGVTKLLGGNPLGVTKAIVWGIAPCQPPQKKYNQGKQLLLAAGPATDKLWTWGLVHVKEDIKLSISLGNGPI